MFSEVDLTEEEKIMIRNHDFFYSLSSLKLKNWDNTMKEIDLIIRNSKYDVF